MQAELMYAGGCLCGAVRYRVVAAPLNQRICHCRLCQRAIGAAFNARLLFRVADVALGGPVAAVHSSPELERVFCRECGTTIASRRAAAGVMGLTSGSLDDPARFVPEEHIYVASKQPWLVLADGLPQWDGAPPPA